MASTASRIRGALYGVAVTDALGGPVEFQWRGAFPPVTGFQYNSNFNLPPGAWTDDTSMTLCLAKSLVDNKGAFVLHDQIDKYIRWQRDGYMSSAGRCFDIGNATYQALRIWGASFGHPAGKIEQDGRLPGQKDIDSALNKERSCGNGSLMRCVPIPLVFYSNPDRAHEYAALASIPTHPHATCVEACQLYTKLIVTILTTASTKQSIFNTLRDYELKSPPMIDILSKYQSLETVTEINESNISSSGFVVHTLDAAIWAFFTTETFAEGALRVVNLGDDADTVGAVYGGLAGAFYGFEAIPATWISGLLAKSIVDEVVQGVVDLAV